MRTEILDRHPSARLRVFVVWFDMLPGDGRGMVDLRLLGDRRVTNFWDDRQTIGRWFAARVPASRGAEPRPISWDVYLLYGPDARWAAEPGPLLIMGRPVIGASHRLQLGIGPLLRA